MSAEDRPGREVAYRLFAAEFDDATLSHAESDRERAPNYVVTPTGARVNRLFVVGTLTEVTPVNEDMVRARIVDPTGAFVVYAGQYQPEALAAIEALDPPAFVAVTGKARTFSPDDSDQVYTSIRPESVATVDGDTRDRWVIDAARRTLERIETYAAAAPVDATDMELADALQTAGVDDGLATGIPLARTHYGTTPGYLQGLSNLATQAAAVVAGERDQVDSFEHTPATGSGEITFDSLAGSIDIDVSSSEREEAGEGDEGTTPSPVQSQPAETEASSTTVAAEPSGADEPVGDASADESSTGAGSKIADPAETEPDVDPVETEPDEGPGETGLDEDLIETEPDADPIETESDGDAGDDGSPAAEPADGADDESLEGELGDFDGGDLYEMDEEERERVESEFGTEFSTGTEVDEPGEAGIQTDDEPGEAGIQTDDEPGEAGIQTDDEPVEADIERDDEPVEAPENVETDSPLDGEGADTEGGSDEASAEPADTQEESDDGSGDEAVDVQALVVETMTALDDGDGADREAVVDAVVEETDQSAEAVEAAIQDALMGGECYEPDEATLKAI